MMTLRLELGSGSHGRDQFKPAHDGHVQVRYDHVDAGPLYFVQCILSVPAFDHIVPGAFQGERDHLANAG
jgi:hypothetical protein